MSSGAMPEITVTTTSDDGKIYLPYTNASSSGSKNSKVDDIKLKKSSFKLDLEPIDNQIQTKLSPDTKNILSFLNGSTPIHVSPATDLEKLFPGSFLVTGSARNTPTTPPGVSFLLQNSDVTEESKEFADSFTAAYTSILQQQETKNEDPNGQTSQFIDISQSLVQHGGQTSLTLTPTLCTTNTANQPGMSSRVYILTQHQIPPQESAHPLAVSCPQTLPSVGANQTAPRSDLPPTSVLLNGAVAGPGITNFHSTVANPPVAGQRRPAPSTVPPAASGPPPPKVSRHSTVDTESLDSSKLSTAGSSSNASSPCSQAHGGGDHDQLKLERKRARNRDAARRCRDRKMGKIITLEQKVKILNDENRKLRLRQAEQREQLVKLKALALDHFQKGCNFEFDLSRVDAALSAPAAGLKQEPDGFEDSLQ